ncbi:hypothetical protein KGF54_002138 [Candida jiufengensis]|uniref:uncharacterized protein n=1 Tax=Candida jiufengensis TaxID=497108 RepID=UPI0022257124|nr:uncharacterized protein KGF54_002138 [Candida jiufengensis]KAI5954363.1 hypothetical protein KGF54_002138 [Candida jiufengensis]
MKLGEALKVQNNLITKVNHIRKLIFKCLKAQEGDTPPFKVDELYKEYVELNIKIRQLKTSILIANSKIQISSERSMMESIVEKDVWLMQQEMLSSIIENGIITNSYNHLIKDISLVEVTEYEAQYNKVCEVIWTLDIKIQQQNWLSDIET